MSVPLPQERKFLQITFIHFHRLETPVQKSFIARDLYSQGDHELLTNWSQVNIPPPECRCRYCRSMIYLSASHTFGPQQCSPRPFEPTSVCFGKSALPEFRVFIKPKAFTETSRQNSAVKTDLGEFKAFKCVASRKDGNKRILNTFFT